MTMCAASGVCSIMCVLEIFGVAKRKEEDLKAAQIGRQKFDFEIATH